MIFLDLQKVLELFLNQATALEESNSMKKEVEDAQWEASPMRSPFLWP